MAAERIPKLGGGGGGMGEDQQFLDIGIYHYIVILTVAFIGGVKRTPIIDEKWHLFKGKWALIWSG